MLAVSYLSLFLRKIEMKNINFEVGKKYIRRDGKIVICVGILDDKYYKGKYPIILVYDSDRGCVEQYASSGKYRVDILSSFDIVSEYKEKPIVDWDAMPAWCNWVAMDSDWNWFIYDFEPELYKGNVSWYGSGTKIPEEYEPQFNGDWKDSLCRRPKK